MGDQVFVEVIADLFAEIGGAGVGELEASDLFAELEDLGSLAGLGYVSGPVRGVIEADDAFGPAGFAARSLNGGAEFVFGAGFARRFGDGCAEADLWSGRGAGRQSSSRVL